MDTQLDKLIRKVARLVPLQEPICIHFPKEMREEGLRALDRYGFVLCTGDLLVDNPRLKHYNWLCLRTRSSFISKKGLYATTIGEDWLSVNKDEYKLRIRAEEYVYSNFRRYPGVWTRRN